MSDSSEAKDKLYEMIINDKEKMNLFINYIINKNKDVQDCDTIINDFIKENNEYSTIRNRISQERINNSQYLCDNC
jgi:hypothetical protein